MLRYRTVVLGCALLLLGNVSVRADRVDDILKDLASGDTGKQFRALANLKQVKDPRVNKAIIERAADQTTSLTIRGECIRFIVTQQFADGLGTLLNIADNTKEPFALRGPAIFGVVQLSGSEHIGLLIKLIREDKEPLVRNTAAAALGSTRDPKITPRIIELLNDPNCAAYAAGALGITGDPSAVQPLIDKLNTKDALLRNTIISSLGRLGDKRSIPPLMELLKGENTGQVYPILAAFGNINDPEVVKTLIAFASNKTGTEETRTRALLSIATLKAIEALTTVGAIAADPGEKFGIRHVATEVLGSLGEQAIPTLLALLDDKILAEAAGLSLGKITGVFYGTDRARWTDYYNTRKTAKPQTPR